MRLMGLELLRYSGGSHRRRGAADTKRQAGFAVPSGAQFPPYACIRSDPVIRAPSCSSASKNPGVFECASLPWRRTPTPENRGSRLLYR
jgi:hypothetical protein